MSSPISLRSSGYPELHTLSRHSRAHTEFSRPKTNPSLDFHFLQLSYSYSVAIGGGLGRNVESLIMAINIHLPARARFGIETSYAIWSRKAPVLTVVWLYWITEISCANLELQEVGCSMYLLARRRCNPGNLLWITFPQNYPFPCY